jgi:hypothetical protein
MFGQHCLLAEGDIGAPIYWRSDGFTHRVGRVLSFSLVVEIGTPPTHHPQARMPPPPFGPGGRGTLAGERVGESQY